MKKVFFFIFLLFSFSCFCAESEIDSLKLELKRTTDEEKLEVLNEILLHSNDLPIKESIDYCKQTIDLSKKLNNNKTEADVYLILGYLYERQNDLKNALYFSKKHLTLINTLHNMEINERFSKMQKKYENEKDQVSRQIIFRNTFMIAFLILLNIAFIIFNRYRKKLYAHRELEEAHDKLETIARKDPLTNLSNRRDMKEKILYEKNRFERSEKPFVIIMSDIDFFKQVNDKFGHDCGDYVLKTISNILFSSIRKQDIVGRWGGEEFILLLPETNLKGGKIVAEKIRKKIYKTEFIYQKNKIPIRMTFGVSVFKLHQEINECIIEADKALYKGKRNGRNKVVLAE